MTTAIRLPWLIPGAFLVTVTDIPLAILGVPVWMIFLAHTIVLLFQFPLHTELVGKLPRPIEFIFNTPSHHRVHHGSNSIYLDKNYAGILILWDRLFGTFAEEVEQVQFGLTRNIETHNPVRVNYYEFSKMATDVWNSRSWRGRFGYVFGPPGWSEKPSGEMVCDVDRRQAGESLCKTESAQATGTS